MKQFIAKLETETTSPVLTTLIDPSDNIHSLVEQLQLLIEKMN